MYVWKRPQDFPQRLIKTLSEAYYKTFSSGCNGQKFTSQSGKLKLKDYPDRFHCRWEIVGPAGTAIRLFFKTGEDDFGIEFHAQVLVRKFDSYNMNSIWIKIKVNNPTDTIYLF